MHWGINGVPVTRPTLYFSPLWKSTFSQTPKYEWPKIAAETRTLPSNSREACARRLVGPPWYIAQSGLLLLRQPALYSCANSYYLPSCYNPVLPSWPVCPCAQCPANFYSRSSVLSPDTSANHNTAAVFSFSPKQTYIRVAGSCTAVNLKFQIITNYQRAAQKQQKYVSQICWDTTLQVRPQLPQCPTICSSSDPNDAQKLLTIGKLEFAALEDVWWMFGCLV